MAHCRLGDVVRLIYVEAPVLDGITGQLLRSMAGMITTIIGGDPNLWQIDPPLKATIDLGVITIDGTLSAASDDVLRPIRGGLEPADEIPTEIIRRLTTV